MKKLSVSYFKNGHANSDCGLSEARDVLLFSVVVGGQHSFPGPAKTVSICPFR